MRSLLRPSVLAAALVFALVAVAAGCSFAYPPALVIGGPPGGSEYQLSEAEFQSQLKGIADDPFLMSNVVGQEATPWANAAKTAYNPEYVTQVLSQNIQQRALVNLAYEHNIRPTAADIATARSQLEQQISTSSQTGGAPVDGKATLAKLGKLADLYVQVGVVGEQLSQVLAPTDDELRQQYEAAKPTLGPSACTSHILFAAVPLDSTTTGTTPTDEQYAAALQRANAAAAQLAGGANFDEVTKATSDDPGSKDQGGQLPCQPQGGFTTTFGQAFEDAAWAQPIGTVGPPIKTTFGYQILRVRTRGVATFEDAKEQLRQEVSSAFVNRKVQAAIQKTKVTIDPQYGHWDAATGKVIPPTPALTPTSVPKTTAPAATPGTTTGSTPSGTAPSGTAPRAQG